MDNVKIVKTYLKIRDARTALKREFEEADIALKQKAEKLENVLLSFLNENNMDSLSTEVGTVFRQEELTPTGADWSAFYQWVRENDAFDFLERRIKKTEVKKYMEEHKGAIPPGVSVFREFVVRIRRK